MHRYFITLVAAGVLTCFGTAVAQEQATEKKEGQVQQRKENQQGRIAKGVQNGSLTPKETQNLERKEGNLNKQIRQDRRANDGKLTKGEKQQINKEQNRLSHQISKDRKNGQRVSK